MEGCGVSPLIFPEETLPTASWLWTVTLTPRTSRNHVGACAFITLEHARGCVCFLHLTLLLHCCRIQVFHCLKHEGTGGRTLLVDGFYAAEKVRQQSPGSFELLARVPIRHEYIENKGTHHNHMTGIGPVLNVYPWNNEMYLIRYVTASFSYHFTCHITRVCAM